MYYSEDTANRARKAVAFDARRLAQVEALLKKWAMKCALSQLGGDDRRRDYERQAGEVRREIEAVIKSNSMFACEGR